MNNRPSGIERVVLVHINFSNNRISEDLEEFKELAASTSANVVDIITSSRKAPDAKYFIGSGKAEEIRESVLAHKAELVIFNHVLSPAQERNLERLINCRVIDRTGLIIDIFANRARSFEGKLQVELAFLKHLSTRLVRGWTHLERQRGGIGLRGGPGETQLEVDRRLIRDKMRQIAIRLTKIRKQRKQSREARRKAIIPTVALVGYTNVGKSTLFNHLTGAMVYTANQLFATLDPTLRRVESKEMGPIILADTVGFIRHLPHDLVEAFHSTLEEVTEADLILHVMDSSDDNKLYHKAQVDEVLQQLEAQDVPTILVYNKIDLTPDIVPKIDYDEAGKVRRVLISAASGHGIPLLLQAIGEVLGNEMVEKTLKLSPKEAKLRALLYQKDAVMGEKIDDEGNSHLQVRLSRVELEKLFS